MMRIALFDFCDTLVNFQTADPFVTFTLKSAEQDSTGIFYCSENISEPKSKEKYLNQLKGLSRTFIYQCAEKYYKTCIKPNLYSRMISILRRYIRLQYKVYLVSGGYEPYLRYFAKDYGIDGVIANEFLFKNQIFTGKIDGTDCMGEEKVCRIENMFFKKNIDYSISYSDSISDLPLLKWTEEGVVVSRKSLRKWASNERLYQIVLFPDASRLQHDEAG